MSQTTIRNRRTRAPLCAPALPLFGMVVLLAMACVSPGALTAQQCPVLVWSDEFDGTAVDQSNWSFQIGDGCAEGICGWGNNELQSYQQANATVSNGTLKIEAREERIRNKQYTSARIRSIDKQDFFFGRFEARLKMTFSQGLWPAFWMLPTDEIFGGWPQSGEIDIMENIGSQPSTVSGTLHFGDPFPGNQSTGGSYSLSGGAQFKDDFHTFAIEKQPGTLRWFVDDVLYSTKTTADTDPFNWPFDERFHFLLNVAVGGNFPGNPDATSVFPQILEVDYVRVWDGDIPWVAGDRVVAHQEAGVVYSIGNAPAGSSFSWTVPAGATLVGGQGTSSITVDWGTTGGDVVADVSSACGNVQRRISVEVEPAFDFDFTFDNFDDPGNAAVTFSTGTLTVVPNPDTTGINPSALAGEYVRSSAEQFDVLVYATAAIPDASQYVTKTRKFFMDLLTTAPAGTEILVQLEDSSQATATNFPAGRHSRFQVFTAAQSAWERLDFAFLDRPDPSVPDTSVDTLIVLFATNTFTGDVFTYDNFDSYLVAGGGGGTPTTMHVDSIVVGTQGAGQGSKRGAATVTLRDNTGGPVGSATVTGTFTGDFNETHAGTTAGDGTVTLATDGVKKGGVVLTFCVDDLTHATLTYAPGENVVTCGSL